MKKIVKKSKSVKKLLSNRLFLLTTSVLMIAIISIAYTLISGSSLVVSPNTINEAGGCKPKTVCTRKTDGRKDCTTYDCPVVNNGVSTVKTSSQIISDTGGTKKVVEYKYEVSKTTPVDSSGKAIGNSTTTEVRKKVDGTNEKVVSTVTTVQTSTGGVISDVRTGDITLGVNGYKSGELDQKNNCEKDANKVWRDSSCQNVDTRSDELKCTQTLSGQSSGNTWLDGKCVMKVTPRSTSSVSINCDKGMCDTKGSPVCYGSYVMTGAGFADGKRSDQANSGDRECTLCGDDGKGGVGYTGSSESCKNLLAKGAPVVMGYDIDPASLGLPKGTKTGSCFSKRGADWVLTPVGVMGEGANEGKYCDPSGNWVGSKPTIVPPLTTPVVSLTGAALCHAQHPGYIFGTNFDGKEVCLPNTTVNRAMLSDANPCKPGKGTLDGKEVMIKCSATGAPSYTFCYGGTGTFDASGNCITTPVQDDPSSETLIPPGLPNTVKGTTKNGYACWSKDSNCESGYCAPGLLLSSCAERPANLPTTTTNQDTPNAKAQDGGQVVSDPDKCPAGKGATKDTRITGASYICKNSDGSAFNPQQAVADSLSNNNDVTPPIQPISSNPVSKSTGTGAVAGCLAGGTAGAVWGAIGGFGFLSVPVSIVGGVVGCGIGALGGGAIGFGIGSVNTSSTPSTPIVYTQEDLNKVVKEASPLSLEKNSLTDDSSKCKNQGFEISQEFGGSATLGYRVFKCL